MSPNKTIAKNTILLYFRMIFTVVISLYVSRIILDKLGVEDFGIYNVVGGVVVMFSFLNGALTSASQRFLSFSLGKNDTKEFKKIYSNSYIIYLIITVIFVMLAETAGLWFLNNQMDIPIKRVSAANWIYQLSILLFIVSTMRSADNAVLIAKEDMGFYATISIIEALLKLLTVLLLNFFSGDKLIVYAWLMLLVAFLVGVIAHLYIRIKYLIKLQLNFDQTIIQKMLRFSGWTTFGSVSLLASNQGVNIVMNIFFGVIVNAAMGIANQVAALANQFLSSFQLAFNPQITKKYAEGDTIGLHSLLFMASRMSYLMMLFLVAPLYIHMPFVMGIWLKEVPEYAVSFSRLTLITLLIDSLSGPLWMAAHATGNIRNYQIVVSIFYVMNLLLTLLFFHFGFFVESALYIKIAISLLLVIIRILYLKHMIGLSLKEYWKNVLKTLIILSLILGFYITSNGVSLLFNKSTSEFLILIINMVLIFTIIFFLGLQKSEKRLIAKKILNYRHLHNK